MYPKTYLEIIYQICNKKSISIQAIENTEILCLSKQENTRYIWSRRFDLNSSIATRIADNKFATYATLNNFGIPVIKCTRLSRIDSEEYYMQIKSNFSICNELLTDFEMIIIKPNNSYEGQDVFKCNSSKDIEKTLYYLTGKYKYIVVSPYINSVAEYRAIYLDGEILFAYKKTHPFIVADGNSSVIQLLIAQKIDISILDDSIIKQLYTVFPKGYHIQLTWKYNLSQGSNCVPIQDTSLYNNICNIAVSAARAINISFASVDILEDTKGNLQVLEINAGVAMDQFIQKYPDGREIAFSIYEKAINKMFN